MFPQFGPSFGFLLSNGTFLLPSFLLTDSLLACGWRIPFLASAVLAAIRLYVRGTLSETPALRDLPSAEGR
jgi:MHS family shikimate/dehydroshikimate transporter-like MFS transporter